MGSGSRIDTFWLYDAPMPLADGQVFALMIMAITSAEVSLALALVVYLHRRRKSVNADDFSSMKG